MNPAVEYTVYYKFHPRLPPFRYNPLATDKLTQLYTTWQLALKFVEDCVIWRDTSRKQGRELIHRIRRTHLRHFLKAFAKAHPLPESKDSDWAFGSVGNYRRCGPRVRAHFAALYKAYRYWRQHQPNLP